MRHACRYMSPLVCATTVPKLYAPDPEAADLPMTDPTVTAVPPLTAPTHMGTMPVRANSPRTVMLDVFDDAVRQVGRDCVDRRPSTAPNGYPHAAAVNGMALSPPTAVGIRRRTPGRSSRRWARRCVRRLKAHEILAGQQRDLAGENLGFAVRLSARQRRFLRQSVTAFTSPCLSLLPLVQSRTLRQSLEGRSGCPRSWARPTR